MRRLATLLLFSVLASCSGSNYGYEIKGNSCTTGKREFKTKEDYCTGLKDNALNNFCGSDSRESWFESNCTGDFNTETAGASTRTAPAAKSADITVNFQPTSMGAIKWDTLQESPQDQVTLTAANPAYMQQITSDSALSWLTGCHRMKENFTVENQDTVRIEHTLCILPDGRAFYMSDETVKLKSTSSEEKAALGIDGTVTGISNDLNDQTGITTKSVHISFSSNSAVIDWICITENAQATKNGVMEIELKNGKTISISTDFSPMFDNTHEENMSAIKTKYKLLEHKGSSQFLAYPRN